MRKLFTLCLLIFSLSASAQWQQTGSKVRYVNGLGIPTKDTAAGVAADSSQILIRPADSSLYVKYKRTWVKVGSGGTIGGSGTTNYIPKFTSSTAIGNSQIFDNGTNVGIGTVDFGASGLSFSNVFNLSFSEGSGASYANIFRQRNTAATVIAHSLKRSGTANFASSFTGSIGKAAVAVGFDNGSISFFSDPPSNVANGTDFTASERMRITSAGNTLIGTTTDNGTDKLQVSGSALSTRYKVNTSGQTINISNYYNGGFGNNLFINNTEPPLTSAGYSNIGIGFEALVNNTSGYTNVAVGQSALLTNNTGYGNFALGASSLAYNTTGYENVAIGWNSLVFNTTGNNNIAFGTDAGARISTGGDNQTSSQSIYIGKDTRASANGNTNEVVIGHTNIGQGSNTVTLGNSSITKTFLRGSVMVNTTTDNGVDKLQVSGSIQGTGFDQAYLARTTAYTATDTDYLIDCTTGTFTVTLPASSGRTGRILIIKNSGTGTITVDGNASETIDGATTYSLSTQYATVQIMSDGTNWKIIAKF